MIQKPLRAYWDLLSQYIRPQKGRFILLAVLLLGSIGLQLLNPQIIGGFIDAALAGAPARELVLAGLAFLGIALLQQAAAVGVQYYGETVAWTATNALRADLARHLLRLDMGFHNTHTPGELIERIDGDVTELATFFSQFVIILLGNLLLMVGILVVLFFEDWRVGLIFTLFAGLSVWILNRMRSIAVSDRKSFRQADSELFGMIEEQLAGKEDVRSNGADGYAIRELFRHQGAMLRHDRRAQLKRWWLNMAVNGLLTGGLLLAVLSGYHLYLAGAITIGTVYLMVFYINMLETPIWELTHQVESFQTIGACVERLTELHALRPDVQDGAGITISSGALGLGFNQVSFAYHTGEPVLQQLSFNLSPGARLGLLGRTGSGKTTLARLVLRLYEPGSGTITLDGTTLNQPRLADLRQRVGMVTQDVQLFRASVRDNITFFDQRITDEQIHQAIQILELEDWFGSLPAGLDTLLEAGSHSLSAGEAQLLAFTRIFLRDPGLVILDEASSRLDPATERRLERAIEHLLKDRTAIIIAHRLGTVSRVDQILILESGQLSEFGDRQELARDANSRFNRLLQTGLEEVLA
jgi:ABC-type multidrug transport system fused ATPase/permease subunit